MIILPILTTSLAGKLIDLYNTRVLVLSLSRGMQPTPVKPLSPGCSTLAVHRRPPSLSNVQSGG